MPSPEILPTRREPRYSRRALWYQGYGRIHSMPRPARSVTALALCLAGLTVLSGCRVTEKDVQRWETTELGPTKLVAVILHGKYDWKLRVDAAVALVRMKPRNGRRVGIGKLQEAIAQLSPGDRKNLMAGLTPVLVAEMDKEPPAQQGGDGIAKISDPSVPFKDAAFALLSYDKDQLVADDAAHKALADALVKWCTRSTDAFDKRVGMSGQLYSVEQVFRFIKADAARNLPALVKPDSQYDRMASFVAELGDDATKNQLSMKLVELARYVEGKEWYDKAVVRVKEANDAGGYKPSPAQLEKQVGDYREEQLTKVFASMKKVGGRPSIDYLLTVAADESKPEKRREFALAAMENRLDRNNANDIATILKIAGAEKTPPAVRQGAFLRAAELPRAAVAPKLYELFAQKDPKNWKIRWVAASTILKMSTAENVPEFFSKLPPGAAPGFASSEGLEYGNLMGQMKPAPVKREEMVAKLKDPQVAGALTALGYFYFHGKAADVEAVKAAAGGDGRALPKVEDEDGARYRCPGPDGKPKDVVKVSEFVELCVLPTMAARK